MDAPPPEEPPENFNDPEKLTNLMKSQIAKMKIAMCRVCWGELVDTEAVALSCCGSIIHQECVQQWIDGKA